MNIEAKKKMKLVQYTRLRAQKRVGPERDTGREGNFLLYNHWNDKQTDKRQRGIFIYNLINLYKLINTVTENRQKTERAGEERGIFTYKLANLVTGTTSKHFQQSFHRLHICHHP